jgi:hypothetical protein
MQDAGGYHAADFDQKVFTRWLGFSAFSPLMEVGPVVNHGIWDLPDEPSTPAFQALLQTGLGLTNHGRDPGVAAGPRRENPHSGILFPAGENGCDDLFIKAYNWRP